MPQPDPSVASDDSSLESALARMLSGFFDPEWYQNRYPDIAAAELDPLQHFIRYGAAEQRDPNGFFDSAWYIEHYPDVATSGMNPLLHYLTAGAAELRNPHARFDAAYYANQHPAARANPLLYHLRIGMSQGLPTERLIDVRDYLPSTLAPLPLPHSVVVDIVVVVDGNLQKTQDCISIVLADRTPPLARIIVVDNGLSMTDLTAWLQERAVAGEIHLIRNRHPTSFAASVNRGIEAAGSHDVILLDSNTEVPAGWVRRLAAHAYSQPHTATVSPFCNSESICCYPSDEGGSIMLPALVDEACRAVNASRSVNIAMTSAICMYIRHDALRAVGIFDEELVFESEFCQRASAAGWHHRVACDTFVYCHRLTDRPPAQPSSITTFQLAAIDPFRFAATAALLQRSKLPVILMISHNLGGGVRRHIDDLSQRYHNAALMLLLEGTDRGAQLSLPSLPNHPALTLPSDRLDDVIAVLRSMNVSRLHLHHLLHMDVDIRTLIARLGVPFDVTVHDYFAICPQINLMMWSEGLYCQEPGPAACNACIADRSSHGARDVVSWRRDRVWQFLDADRVICPSNDVKARLARFGLGERAIVVPHDEQTATQWPIDVPEFNALPLRIVLLGVLANHKGARAVAEVAEAAEAGTIEIHLIGHLEESFPKSALSLIKTTGKYQDGDLPDLLARVRPHVFWFPSPCPETFSYTLGTAIETGLPIVATDLGSLPERLAGRPHSWVVDHRASATDWLRTFDAVRVALLDRAVHPPVIRQQQPPDFYTHRYLSPERGKATARNSEKPRIAIVPERFDTGGLTPCAYIRLLQPLDHPLVAASFDVMLSDVETIFDCDADVIVTQRYAIPDPATATRLAEHASRTGAKLLFDLDDDLLNVPTSHPDAARLHPLAATVRRMLAVADTVWVSTPGLAKGLSAIRPDAVVIENALDERIWVQGAAANPFWDDPIRILCMGTTTHTDDFAMIEPCLVRLKAEYGERIVIDILGMTSRDALPAGLNRIGPPVHGSRSYPGFVNWLTSMQPRWHIGLAPLLDTPFNRSKSPIKAMDYAALGLTVLASDTPVYQGSIADGPAGQLVANDPGAWHGALDWLIRNQDLRQSGALRARQAFLSRGTLASQADTRRDALTQLLPSRMPRDDNGLRQDAVGLTMLHGSTDPVARKGRHSTRGR